MNCPKCGFKNPDGARFCNQCGAQLQMIAPRRDRGQRRRVAVLFSDISGFTPLSESLDPEEVRDLIDACLQRLAGVIYQYDGYIDKFIGDCIMALFGAPVTHEDDPLRAVIAALEQMKEIKKFNREKNLDLSLSIGINYGLVATGDLGRPGEYTVMGDVVNLAQRLQYAAPRGRIYASEEIFENTKNEINYKKLKKIRVKGKRELITVYEPQGVKRHYSLRKIKELPLIGRSDELHRLLKIFAEARAGRGGVVSVVGEAGIGKSKLTFEFKKQIKNHACILEGRGIEYLHASPYLVLKELTKELLGVKPDDSKESAARKLTGFIKKTDPASLKKTTIFLKYFLDMSLNRADYNRFESMRARDRIRMINEALISFFIAVSRNKPLVMIFEDCHWIDSETVNFMRRFAKEIVDKKIMVLALFRPEFNIGKGVSRLAHYSRINLGPLPEKDAVILVHNLLQCRRIDEKLVKLLMKKSNRIPFYIHELTNNLVAGDAITVSDGVAYLKRGKESAVPRTLDELVMAKIDRLNTELRTIVDIASVIGDEFSTRVLNTMLELDQRLTNDLALLVQKGIIRVLKQGEEGTSDKETYTFSHSLMREAVYQSLLKQTRKEYHKQIGYAIELVYSENLREYYDTLANHFLLGGVKEKAVEYLEKAGDRKRELYLNEEAISLYTQSLGLLDKSEKLRSARIYEKLGNIYELIGEYDSARQAYRTMARSAGKELLWKVKASVATAKLDISRGLFDEAVDLLNRAGKALKRLKKPGVDAKIELANVLRIECWVYRIKGRVNKAEEKGLEAIAILKSIKHLEGEKGYNAKHVLLLAHHALAIVYSFKGEYDRAIHLLEEALIIAEDLGNRRALGDAYNNLGTIYRTQGRFEQAINAFSNKLEISRELGDKSGIGIAYCNLGNVYENKGEYEKAINFHNDYLKISEELGNKHGIGQAAHNLGVAYWKKGEYGRAIKSLEKSLRISEELGDKRMVSLTLEALGEVYASRFEFPKAVKLFNGCLRMSRKLGDKWSVGSASYHLGYIYTRISEPRKAEKYLSTAKDIFEKIGNKVAIGNTYTVISELRIQQNRFEEALHFANAALKLAEETNSTEMKITALKNTALVYDMKDSAVFRKRSRQLFKKAVTIARKLNNKRLLADLYYDYAAVLKRGDKKVDKKFGDRYYRQALKYYQQLKIKRKKRF